MREAFPEKSHAELRECAKPMAPLAGKPASGIEGRLPVPPWPSVYWLDPPWPPSAPPVLAPFRYHSTDPTPWPPMRSDTSVPGIRSERGKLRSEERRVG